MYGDFEPTEESAAAGHRERGPRPRAQGLEILFQDAALFVVNKPPGMWSAEGMFDEPGVVDVLRNSAGDDCATPSCIYPVESEISGVMVWARGAANAERLAGQIESGGLGVLYLAIVRATVMEESGAIELPLREGQSEDERSKVDERRGRPARTVWRLRDRFVGLSLLECRPSTTIRSQVRAHLRSGEMPVVADGMYGGGGALMLSSFKAGYHPSRRRPERPLIERPAIHVCSVAFEHPQTGERLSFEAPAPKDFRAALHQLERFGRIPK